MHYTQVLQQHFRKSSVLLKLEFDFNDRVGYIKIFGDLTCEQLNAPTGKNCQFKKLFDRRLKKRWQSVGIGFENGVETTNSKCPLSSWRVNFNENIVNVVCGRLVGLVNKDNDSCFR